KKGSDLGDYDPLTQADSDDESEEDDLVLNYPRNGLGRDSCLGSGSSKLRGGRSGRHVGATDEVQDEEDEEEEDEWTDQFSSKSRKGRENLKGSQYWSHRDSGIGQDRGGTGSSGSAGLGAHSSEAAEKRKRAKNAIRSAFFLVPLACTTLIVLLCAFLVPCQKAELEKKLQWERALGDAAGVSPPALAVWDIDGDARIRACRIPDPPRGWFRTQPQQSGLDGTGCRCSRAAHQKALPDASGLSHSSAAAQQYNGHSSHICRSTLFEPHSCRIASESVNMASAALARLLRLSAVRNGRLSPRSPSTAPGRTVTPSRTAVCTSSGAILPKPKKISKSFAALLEEHDIFVPEDDDDDD
ncbi:hypothetical protein GOODEAATRI_002837, partial [Goodea atripinnis]